MAKPLESVTVEAPGFYGLNTQEAVSSLSTGWALRADNCIIDSYGRLGSRRGWTYETTQLNSVVDDNIGVDIEGIHHYMSSTGAVQTFSWDDGGNFYLGTSNLITTSPTGAGTVTSGNYQAATLFDKVFFFQDGHVPLVYDDTGTPAFTSVATASGYSGTVPQGSCVMAAYGRLWVGGSATDSTTLYWSDLGDGVIWDTGTAGSLDLQNILTGGTDEIIGLGAHNGYLVIFMRNHIIIYGDSETSDEFLNPSTLQLVEVIEGIGCIARDSIQNTGTDLLFLSASGMRSLGRTIQEKSQPIADVSKNVRKELLNDVAEADYIKSTYAPKYGFYLLALRTAEGEYMTWCFDTRLPLPDGALRVTTWLNQSHKAYAYEHVSETLYFGQTNGLAIYSGYQDNSSSYTMYYYTNYEDMDLPTTEKIAKKVGVVIIGPGGQTFNIKLGVDYEETLDSYTFTLSDGQTPSEYGIAEYGIGEFTGGLVIDNVITSVGGYGAVFQAGFEADISGTPFSLQKLDIFLKKGRLV